MFLVSHDERASNPLETNMAAKHATGLMRRQTWVGTGLEEVATDRNQIDNIRNSLSKDACYFH